MFEELAEAIENLVVPAESEALAEVFRLHGRLGAKATLAAADFDVAGHWGLDGSASMTAWMRVHLRLTNQQTNRISPTDSPPPATHPSSADRGPLGMICRCPHHL